MNSFYVYAWIRPDTGEVFYIGKGSGRRAASMVSRNEIFLRIVAKLERDGFSPTFEYLHKGLTENDAFCIECAEIAKRGRICKGTGHLANITDGGEGASGAVRSKETCAKIGDAHRGKKATKETLEKLRKASLGRTHTPESRAKMSRATLGRSISEETRKKMSVAKRGTKHTKETCAKISDMKRGIEVSEETRAKISKAHLGRKLSAESRLKIGDAHRGKNVSEETREKMSKARLGMNVAQETREKMSNAKRMAGPGARNKTGFLGVSVNGKKYHAQIRIGCSNLSLGLFATAAEAAQTYDKAAVDAFGVGNCYVNFPQQCK